jgi:hypothetical protein
MNAIQSEACIICLKVFNDQDNIYKLDCGHCYHTNCIINWFRTENSKGRCPCCNDNQHININYQPWYTRDYVEERCKILRKYNRKKDSPQQLNEEFIKLKHLENTYNINVKERSKFIKSEKYKDIIKELKDLDKKKWNSNKKVKKQKTKIVSMFPNINLLN